MVAGTPLSLLDVRDRLPELFYSRMHAWYNHSVEAAWAAAPVAVRWHLLRKEPVPGSLRKTFGERRNLLSDGERVPRSGEVADIFVLLALVTGQCLLPDVWVRCRDKSSSGFHIGVGGFGSDGFGVRNYWDGQRRGYLGLASPRRS